MCVRARVCLRACVGGGQDQQVGFKVVPEALRLAHDTVELAGRLQKKAVAAADHSWLSGKGPSGNGLAPPSDTPASKQHSGAHAREQRRHGRVGGGVGGGGGYLRRFGQGLGRRPAGFLDGRVRPIATQARSDLGPVSPIWGNVTTTRLLHR